jgi:hypothetical protein
MTIHRYPSIHYLVDSDWFDEILREDHLEFDGQSTGFIEDYFNDLAKTPCWVVSAATRNGGDYAILYKEESSYRAIRVHYEAYTDADPVPVTTCVAATWAEFLAKLATWLPHSLAKQLTVESLPDSLT